MVSPAKSTKKKVDALAASISSPAGTTKKDFDKDPISASFTMRKNQGSVLATTSTGSSEKSEVFQFRLQGKAAQVTTSKGSPNRKSKANLAK
jgi:hypothetical protein